MGIRYLWDTNVVIYYLQQQFPAKAEAFIDKVIATQQPIISAITEIELLCWRTSVEDDIKLLQSFINDSLVLELELPVKLKTAEIRRSNRIKLPDAIIAATAMIFDLTLLTRNTSDFSQLKGLEIMNPWEM